MEASSLNSGSDLVEEDFEDFSKKATSFFNIMVCGPSGSGKSSFIDFFLLKLN